MRGATAIWRGVVGALAAGLLTVGAAQAAWVWHPDAGWIDTEAAPGSSAEGLFAWAVGLKMQGHINSALDLLERLRAYPMTGDLRFKLAFHEAECLLSLGRVRDAISTLRAAVKSQPGPEWSERLLRLEVDAGLQLLREDSDAGRAALADALSKKPPLSTAIQALLALGRQSIVDRRWDEARAFYDEAARVGAAGADLDAAVMGRGWSLLLASCDGPVDKTRVEQAINAFREVAGRARSDEPIAELARECSWVAQSLQIESSSARRAVFASIARFLWGDREETYPVIKDAANKYHGTPVGEAARFFAAEYWLGKEEYYKAFEYYEELMEQYSGTLRVQQVATREFMIGKKLMVIPQGFRWESWRLARASEVLGKVIEHNPSGRFADEAQLLIGDCHFQAGAYDEAYDAYQAVIEDYPNSKWAPMAQFKSGLSRFRQAELTEDKSEILLQCSRALEVYLRTSPTGVLAGEARDMLGRVRSREAALQWNIVKLYERTDRPRAAAYVLEQMVRDYSDTAWAGLARQRLQAYAAKGYVE